ncbi:diacylglycerol O-acyltransferase 1 [Rhizopus stolonifer]|uniref:Diacylglycerol O-acyltransferase n=1 Tax=Rhizopus stolonifer TaxID=4846 RepID=A0A367KLR3_RHIST|nr:diacylglycerol O-acyltransferase 1 [Rhizopus stolonifer]
MDATISSKIFDYIPDIHWAPIRGIPIERRLQTTAVLTWMLLMGSCVLISCLSLTFPILWPIHIVYLIYLWTNQAHENGGRPSAWFRQLSFWRYFADYFPAKLVKEADLDASKNYIFGYHPHGIISLGAVANFATEATGFSKLFPGIMPSLLTLTANFKIPLYRDIILALGIASVSRHSCETILTLGPGRSIVIVVGGASESLRARPGTADLTLQKRLGFIRMAIRHQAGLVPTFSFGENDIYEQVDSNSKAWLWKLQKGVQRFMGFTIPLFHARGIFNYNMGLLPYRRPIVTVVGRPIPVPKLKDGQTEPTQDQLLSTQALYIEELKSIYDKYKDVYARDRKQDLCIVA